LDSSDCIVAQAAGKARCSGPPCGETPASRTILLHMQNNPAEDLRQLSAHYREITDAELEELGDDLQDLTETAQQALRIEMKNRGLGEPGDPRTPQALSGDPNGETGGPDIGEGEGEVAPGYTWKTLLCECEDREHASQIVEMLRRADIESWIDQPGRGWVVGGPRVTVAADQLEQARAVAAQPVPQDIVELSRTDLPEFVAPRCPACGAEDPVLEGVVPSNSWLCEACGEQWTEPAPDETSTRR